MTNWWIRKLVRGRSGPIVLVLALLGAAPAALAAAVDNELAAGAARSNLPWVGAWSSPPVRPGVLAVGVPFYADTGGRTVRNVVHATLGGSELRLRLTNVFGSHRVTFNDVRIGLHGVGAAIVPGTNRRVRFSTQASVSIPAGGQAVSDPVKLPIRSGQDLTVSIYTAAATGNATTAGSLNHTTYISTSTNAAGDEGAASFTTVSRSWYWISGVDVLASVPSAGAIVALGDSITAGYDSTLDANRDWVDLLANRLQTARPRRELSVLNAGIAGNNLHQNTSCFGQSALTRLTRDALDQTGVRYVIVDEGANDITHPREPASAPLYACIAHRKISADGMIALFKRAITRIHARQLKAVGVTISPFGGYAYWSPVIESERGKINRWIRTGHAFDGVIDFDAALRDPVHPARLNPRYDSGDHLHPNDAGHAAMARGIRPGLFR